MKGESNLREIMIRKKECLYYKPFNPIADSWSINMLKARLLKAFINFYILDIFT